MQDFQQKCLGKIRDVPSHGRTVLFVSHNIGMISSLCERCIVLDGGGVLVDGSTAQGVETYLKMLTSDENTEISFLDNKDISGQLTHAYMVVNGKQADRHIDYDKDFGFRIGVDIREPGDTYSALFSIRNSMGEVVIFSSDRDLQESPLTAKKRKLEYSVQIPGSLLTPGAYFVRFQLVRRPKGCRQGGDYLSDNGSNQLRFHIRFLTRMYARFGAMAGPPCSDRGCGCNSLLSGSHRLYE